MWILSGIDDGSYFNLLCDSSSIVSREGPGHIILHDKSVSKAHASFCLTYHDRHLSHPEILPEVLLRDLQSTNGTYIRSESSDYKKLDPDTPVTLKQGDIIRFGRNKKFRLKYQPFIITSSQITNKNVKEQLKECVRCLGGHLVKEWIPDCSLLIMNDLFITAKTVCALAAGANIVTPAYLIDMKTAIKEKKPLPDIKKYLPVLKEPSIRSTEVSFYPNLSRKKLFIGKTFFFQNEGSLNRMKQSVVEAELLKANKLHPIPESDIGLAVVYNSIEKYCSPKFRMSGILQPNSSMSQCPSLKMEVYATETQHETESLPTTLPSRTTIPESGGSSGRSNIVASSKANEPQCKTDIEKNSIGEMNKENIGRRKRSFADSTSPNEKVSESKSKKANLSKISNDTVETIVDDEVDNTINFQPSQFSTQKLSPVNCKKRKSDEFAVPESTVVRKNVRLATPQKVITEMHEESLEISSISKSIPFEPYTLPSINIANMEEEEPSVADEEEKETQIFSGGVKDLKKEPVSQGKIHQIEETPEGNVLDDGWIKAVSTKPPSQNREEADRAKSSFLKPNPVPLVNETLSKEENEFALSFSSKKRKGRLFSSSQ
ncbi:Nibrin [Armadillidium vulgare]|nr:Nibrin [Armadillidium vulgare]